jgi:hypothetical protein
MYYEAIEAVKDEMLDAAQDIQVTWNTMYPFIGEVAGLLGPRASLDLGWWKKWETNPDNPLKLLSNLMQSLSSIESGHSIEDIDIKSANEFLIRVNDIIATLMEDSHQDLNNPLGKYRSTPEKQEDARYMLTRLVEMHNILSGHVKKASKIFKVIKKIRDTSFLPLYTEMPAAA